MVLKKKVTAAVLAGVLATAAVVPMGLTASAASEGDVKVNYVAGALIPETGDGTYYVTIPSSITFTAQNETKTMDVSLKATDKSATLSSTLKVDVKVYSKNNYKLTSTTAGTTQGTYQLKYHLNNAANGTLLANKTPAAGTQDTPENKAQDLIANQKLTKTNHTFKGQAKLSAAPNDDVAAGTTYSDTLTYFVTEVSK